MNSLPPELEAQIRNVAQQANCPVEAVLFVSRGLPQTSAPASEASHIDAAEFCWRLHDQAITLFGDQAREQLKAWAVESTSDIGRIVFAMIDEGLAKKSDTDRMEDFENVFDFETAFAALRYPPRPRLLQFRIATLLLITTVTALALPGAIANGAPGALGTLFAAWLVVIGGFCLWLGARDRSRGRMLALVFAALFCIVGSAVFVLMSSPIP